MATKNRLHGRGTNWSKMPTGMLTAILNDPYTRGIDGKDYYPFKEELQSELWARSQKAHEELIAQYNRDQKEYMRYLATSHKRNKTA